MKHIKSSTIEVISLFLILALSAYLRLYRIGDNPGFNSDEGTAINIAYNLMQGKVQYLAINQSTLLFAKLPLFSLALAGLFKIFGPGIETLRVFTALLGVLSVALLYGVLRFTFQGEKLIHLLSPGPGVSRIPISALPLLSAFFMAIYPQAILYNRIGISYNLLTPLILLTFGGLAKYLENEKPGWLILAALALGIGTTNELIAFSFLPAFVIIVSSRSLKAAIWSLCFFALPFFIYTVVMLVTVPQAFIFDLAFTMTRVGSIPLLGQLPVAALDFAAVAHWDAWALLAVIGMLVMGSSRIGRMVVLFYLLTFIMIGGKTIVVGLGYYYISPIFPFVATGIAGLVIFLTQRVFVVFSTGIVDLYHRLGWKPENPMMVKLTNFLVVILICLALFIFVLSPYLVSMAQMVTQASQGIQTSNNWAMVDPNGARQVAAYINRKVHPGDLVIASPAIAWMFHTDVTDFQQVVAAKGIATIHLPSNIPANRFAFSVDEKKARFVVIDRIWRNWASVEMPAVKDLMEEVEKWRVVFSLGEFTVYENPSITPQE